MLSAWQPSHHVHKSVGGTLKNCWGGRAGRGCNKHVRKADGHLQVLEAAVCLASCASWRIQCHSSCEMIYILSAKNLITKGEPN